MYKSYQADAKDLWFLLKSRNEINFQDIIILILIKHYIDCEIHFFPFIKDFLLLFLFFRKDKLLTLLETKVNNNELFL